MPIEIRELIIKATVTDEQGSQRSSSAEADKEQLVSVIVDQVLDILNEKEER